MMIVSQFRQLNLSVVNVRTYLFAVLFVGGNMLLPQLCHLMPDGGKIFSDYPFMHLLYSQLLVCQRVCLQNTVCLICK